MRLRRHWNRFLNWLIPGRRSNLISEIIKRNQELGLYAINYKCCGNCDEFGKCECTRIIDGENTKTTE